MANQPLPCQTPVHQIIPGEIFHDDYHSYSPEDSDQWLRLFVNAYKISPELSSILMFVRNTGAKLIRNNEYGYIIRPVIGADGFQTQQEYDDEKKCMLPFKNQIVELLRGLKT